MDYLKFHTEELPQLAGAGARYVVVACCGNWRDGEVTNSTAQIARLQRELRKRFMNRFSSGMPASAGATSERRGDKGALGGT